MFLLRCQHPPGGAVAFNAVLGGPADHAPQERLGFTRANLDGAIKDDDAPLDVREDDLEQTFHNVELRAYRRRSGTARCGDIMSRDLVVALPETDEGFHHLPVVNERRRVIGMVTQTDLVARRKGDGDERVVRVGLLPKVEEPCAAAP